MAVKRWTNDRRAFFDTNGNAYEGARLFFYQAGTSTKQATFNSSSGSVANSDPITLNARGEPATEIWLTTGVSYKVGLAVPGSDDPPSGFIWTEDNISPINDTSITLDEWQTGTTPTYVSSTSFTVVGDQTAIYQVGRRLKFQTTGGTKYGTIASSAYTTLTTITINTGEGPLDSGLSSVSYGILSLENYAFPIVAPWYLTGVSGTNTITASSNLGLTLIAGMEFRLIAAETNTGAVTLNIDGIGAKSITKFGATALTAGDIPAGALVKVAYDGTRYQLISASGGQTFSTDYLTSVSGTNTITAAATPTLVAYVTGQKFRLIPANTNTGAATINIDSVGAKNIFLNGSAVVGYELKKNCPIELMYDGTQFHILSGAYGGHGMTAEVRAYSGAASTPPSGWLVCDGSAVSRTTYADLFGILSTTFGAGNGSTTFNIPDLRGRAVFGVDNMGGSAANRVTNAGSGITGTTRGGTGGSEFLQTHNHTDSGHTHGVTDAGHAHNITDPGHSHLQRTRVAGAGGDGPQQAGGATQPVGDTETDTDTTGITINSGTTGVTVNSGTATIQNTGSGSSQNMPPAIMLNYIIKI